MKARCLVQTQVIEGTPQQIAEAIARLGETVVRAVIFTEEPAARQPEPPQEDFFAGTEPYMCDVPGVVDYSREAIYSPRDSE